MRGGSARLAELIDELHEVNRQLIEAARPLEGLANLNLAQRQSLGDEIRAGLARWDSLRQRIAEVLEDPAKDVSHQDG